MPGLLMLLDAISNDPFCAGSTQGIRERLKRATAAAHHALDERLGGWDLSTTTDYRRFLLASAAALLPLENALEQAGVDTLIEDWAQRRRTQAIITDLADLGDTFVSGGAALRPLDRAGMLGTLYVLEGSRLGAVYLLRVVSAAADPRVRRATRYLRHGAGQGLWRSFLARLADEPATPEGESRMIETARMAFVTFATAMASA